MSLDDPRPPPELLTVKQAMARVPCSRRTLYNWIARGFIAVVYTAGGSPRILAESLIRSTKVPTP